jgi:uncharacterized membrane protein
MKVLRVLIIISLIVGVAAGAGRGAVRASGHQFTTLDAPQAGTRPGQGTSANGINQRGDIVGSYVDGKGIDHGFLLHQGRYTRVDFPKAWRTQVFGINEQGDMVGNYSDAKTTYGFLRHQGRYTTLHDPKAGSTGFTFANGINAQGDVVGQYFDSKHVSHGFLLHQGRYTTLDHPGAGTRSEWMGTYPTGINQQGDIVGSYVDSTGARHGFLRHQGRFTTLNAPQAASPSGTGGAGTVAASINQQGDVAGVYFDRNLVLHGFLLHQGRYTRLDHPKAARVRGASKVEQLGTTAFGISNQGDIVGTYGDSKGVSHGFLWH